MILPRGSDILQKAIRGCTGDEKVSFKGPIMLFYKVTGKWENIQIEYVCLCNLSCTSVGFLHPFMIISYIKIFMK